MAEAKKNGANRCPHCGSTDVSLDLKSGKLKCNFCRSLFDAVSANANGGVDKLVGRSVGSGATDIIPDEKTILTLKCPACGAEVVIDTDEVTSARCHWCRHVLSVNEKMPNGAVPDLVLPFKLDKKVAEDSIDAFVKKRQFFAHPKFKKEFSSENVMGVYLPYMVVDANAHSKLVGEAEHLVRKYTVGSGDDQRTYYDADAYNVSREFDLLVDDLTIEASSDKLKQDALVNTNNVIDAIMPFDTENAVAWDARYLRGFASEKRDTNVDELESQIELQVGDIARYKAHESMTFYDRGARWDSEDLKVKGTKWEAAYLPVWLYSYLQQEGDKKMLHYVAVNARTGETMGSVPIFEAKLKLVAALVEILGIFLGIAWFKYWITQDTDSDDNPAFYGLVGLTPGFIFYWVKKNKYRNLNARHKHEAETKATVENLQKTDEMKESRKRLSNSRIMGENDNQLKGALAKNGASMMGEKMANFLGIGRLVGSDPGMTPVGQAAETDANRKHKTIRAVTLILIVFGILFLAICIVSLASVNSSLDEEGSTRNSTNNSLNSGDGNGSFDSVKLSLNSWKSLYGAEEDDESDGIYYEDSSTTDGFAYYDNTSAKNSGITLYAKEKATLDANGHKNMNFSTQEAVALGQIFTTHQFSKSDVVLANDDDTKMVWIYENTSEHTYCNVAEIVVSGDDAQSDTTGKYDVYATCAEIKDFNSTNVEDENIGLSV